MTLHRLRGSSYNRSWSKALSIRRGVRRVRAAGEYKSVAAEEEMPAAFVREKAS